MIGRLISRDIFFFTVMEMLLVRLNPDMMVKVMFLILPCIIIPLNNAFVVSHEEFLCRQVSPLPDHAPESQAECRWSTKSTLQDF